MLEARKIRNDDREITTALFLNVILPREKLTFKKIFTFSYHYHTIERLKDSLGWEDKVWDEEGNRNLQKSLSVCLKKIKRNISTSSETKKGGGRHHYMKQGALVTLCQSLQDRMGSWNSLLQEMALAGHLQKFKKALGRFVVDRLTLGC